MQQQQSLLTSSDPLSESCLSIFVGTSALHFIHLCQSSQLNFSVDSSKRLQLISSAEIMLMLTVQLTTVDQSYGLKINLKCYILIIFLSYFCFSPENSLWDDFN